MDPTGLVGLTFYNSVLNLLNLLSLLNLLHPLHLIKLIKKIAFWNVQTGVAFSMKVTLLLINPLSSLFSSTFTDKINQSCVLWGSGLTNENVTDLERTQKTFTKLVLEEDYRSYKEALQTLGLCSLLDHKKALTLRFVKQSLADGHFADLFPKRRSQHEMEKWMKEEFKVFRAHTNRYKNSPIIKMQSLLNSEEQ